MKDELLSSAEAAEVIGVSEVMIHKWRKSGTGPAYLPGEGRRKFLYSRRECVRFARERQDPVDRIRALERRMDALAGEL